MHHNIVDSDVTVIESKIIQCDWCGRSLCNGGTYVKVYSIENMVNPDFKSLIKDLKTNRQLTIYIACW